MEERGERTGIRMGGVSPTICVGAHSGVAPKIIIIIEDE